MSLSHIGERHGAPARKLSERPPSPNEAARGATARPAAFAPWLEQAILFGMFSAAAGFWMAVIWFILR